MGLRPWEFGRLTPADFREMAEAFSEQVKRANHQLAVLLACLYNVHRDPRHGRPLVPEDFLGGARPARRAQTAEEMFETVKRLHLAFGGDTP